MNVAILLVDDDSIVLTLIHHMMHEVAPDYELLSVVEVAEQRRVVQRHPTRHVCRWPIFQQGHAFLSAGYVGI